MKLMSNIPKKYLIATLVVVIMLIFPGIYFFRQYEETKKLINNPAELSKEQKKELINQVEKVFSLPKNEEPTVATVTDVEKLKVQPFFANAENGDKVLIYTQAKKAILYRPSESKVIDVTTINIGDQNQTPTATRSGEIKKPINVALYNGTKTVGLTKTMESDLKAKNVNVEIVNRADAKKDYTKTLVIDLMGGLWSDEAKDIANLIHGEIAQLPAGEAAPEKSDILIIIGSDYVKK